MASACRHSVWFGRSVGNASSPGFHWPSMHLKSTDAFKPLNCKSLVANNVHFYVKRACVFCTKYISSTGSPTICLHSLFKALQSPMVGAAAAEAQRDILFMPFPAACPNSLAHFSYLLQVGWKPDQAGTVAAHVQRCHWPA